MAALAAWCDASAGPDFVEQRLAAAHRMAALAQDRVSLLLARRLALVAHLERGDLATVDAEISAYDRTAEAAGVALYRWLPAIWRGMRALLRGDPGAALGWADAAERIGAKAGSRNAALLVFTLRMQGPPDRRYSDGLRAAHPGRPRDGTAAAPAADLPGRTGAAAARRG